MPVRLTPDNLLDIITAGVEPLLTLAENKEQTITIDVPGDILVLATISKSARGQNIVHNAVKFSPNGGQIHITATTTEDEAIIAVRHRSRHPRRGPGASSSASSRSTARGAPAPAWGWRSCGISCCARGPRVGRERRRRRRDVLLRARPQPNRSCPRPTLTSQPLFHPARSRASFASAH